MRRLYALLLVLLTALPAQAQTLPQSDPIRQTIQSQLDAMAAGDYAQAFTFASPKIKRIFGSPDRFEAMVKQGYPMVAANDEVRMLELRNVAGSLWQRVLIVDTAGKTHLLDYMMIETQDGWQINAVQLLPSAGVAA